MLVLIDQAVESAGVKHAAEHAAWMDWRGAGQVVILGDLCLLRAEAMLEYATH